MFGIEDMEMGQETFSGRDITMAHHHDRSTHIAEKLEWNAEHHVLVSLLGNDGVHLGRATDIGINDYIKRVSNEPSAVYCPEGSALPKPVRSGFYSVGGDNSTNTTRNGQVICPKGSFCVGELHWHEFKFMCSYSHSTIRNTNRRAEVALPTRKIWRPHRPNTLGMLRLLACGNVRSVGFCQSVALS